MEVAVQDKGIRDRHPNPQRWSSLDAVQLRKLLRLDDNDKQVGLAGIRANTRRRSAIPAALSSPPHPSCTSECSWGGS